MVKVNPGQSRIVVDAKYPEEAFPQIYQGMSEFALVSGRFSTVDLLHYLLSRIGPAYADCASWCGSFQTMRSVQDFFEDGRIPDENGHDSCIGTVPGARSVCCGHGVTEPILILSQAPVGQYCEDASICH